MFCAGTLHGLSVFHRKNFVVLPACVSQSGLLAGPRGIPLIWRYPVYSQSIPEDLAMWDQQQQWDTSAEVQIRVNVRYHPCVWPPPQTNSGAPVRFGSWKPWVCPGYCGRNLNMSRSRYTVSPCASHFTNSFSTVLFCSLLKNFFLLELPHIHQVKPIINRTIFHRNPCKEPNHVQSWVQVI